MMPIARSKDQIRAREAHYKREGGGSEPPARNSDSSWLLPAARPRRSLPGSRALRHPFVPAFVGVSPKASLASALSPYASVFWRRSESTAFERAPANGWHFRQYIARGRRRVSGPPAKQAPPIRKSRSQPGGTPTTSPTDSSCQSSQRRHRFYRLERPKMCLIQCHGACWMTFVAPLPPSER